LDRAHAETALVLGDCDARQPKLGELLPQVGPETVAASGIAPVAKLLRRPAFLAEEGRRGLLQHALVVSQQAHAPGSPRICLARILSWPSLLPPSMTL